MTKLAVTLCAALALLASATNAAIWADSLRTVEISVQRVIEDATSKVEGDFATSQLRSTKLAADLADRATDFGAKIWDEVSSVTQNVTGELKKFNGRTFGLCIADCMKLSERLGRIALLAIKTTRDCVNRRVKIGFARLKAVDKVTNDALIAVAEIRETAQRCGDDVDGLRSAAVAIRCAKANARDATWIPIRSAQKLSVGWTGLEFLSLTLRQSLARCGANKRLATFRREASTVVEKTAQCVQRKIDEKSARGNRRSNEKNVNPKSEMSH